MKGSGFGRLVIDGVAAADPYLDGLDDRPSFEVLSDDGSRYRVDRHQDGWLTRWTVFRIEPPLDDAVGTVTRHGNHITGYAYQYAIGDGFIPAGDQGMLINAVFSLI